MSARRALTIEQARRAAVAGAMLAGGQPPSLLAAVRHLGGLQMDPTSVVERAERLVLFSRLGRYDVEELRRELFERGSLFEYWAYIVPMADFAVHRETMRSYPRGDGARARYTRGWLQQNAAFRRHVLGRLRREGPLRSRDFDDRAAVPWRTGGWNDGRNVGQMLESLWMGGRIATAGRVGGQRLWDLAERRYPVSDSRLPAAEIARRLIDGQLRWRGISRIEGFGRRFDGRQPSFQRALKDLVAEEVVVPIEIDGVEGVWYAHRTALRRLSFDRTVLLAPFDRLVADRDRVEELFGFRYRLEMYVPVSKRRHGHYVLPILHGDRLIGRVDPRFDRRTRALAVRAVYAETAAPPDAGPAVAAAIGELADWLGAARVDLGRELPRDWARALRAIG